MNEKDSEKLLNDPSAFRQRVRMAAVQVAGLAPDELASALAYEVEPFSGIPAGEAEVAYRVVVEPDPSVRVYDVAVRRRSGRGTKSSKGFERWLVPAYVFAALVVLAVGADYLHFRMRHAALAKEVAVQSRLEATLQSIRNRTKSRRDEASALRAAREAAIAAQDAVEKRRALFPGLLSVIGSAFADRAVLKSIASGEGAGAVRLAAAAANAEAAAEALTRLTAAATAKGWKVKTGGMSSRTEGATVAFDCEVLHD